MSATPADESYGAFAYAYDRGLGELFFKAVKPLLAEMLDKYPTPKRTHLDFACGTGLAMQFFQQRGFKSTGVDISLPMLRMARKRSPRLIAADVRSLAMRRKFARITCLYDSLNHMLEREDLVAAFRSVRAAMDDDSLFLFDMNHPDIYPEVWGMNEPYVAEGNDYLLQIATTYRKRERLGTGLVTGWAMINGVRIPIHETHYQRAYREKDIVAALNEAGLEVAEVIDFDPFHESDALQGAGVKLFFVVRVKV